MNSKIDCGKFDAVTPEGMYSLSQCQCGKEEATFSFFDGRWLCVDNADLQEREGTYTMYM